MTNKELNERLQKLHDEWNCFAYERLDIDHSDMLKNARAHIDYVLRKLIEDTKNE